MFRRIGNFIQNVVSTVANIFGRRSPRPLDWEWTIKDQLGGLPTEVNDLFKEYMKDEGIKAGQFALRVNGVLTLSVAYTWAERGYYITEPDSVMRIASCSKTFTTAAILDLVAKTLITGNEKVFEFLGITENASNVSNDPQPRDGRVKDITIRHLVQHQGGWDYVGRPNDWVFQMKKIGRDLGLHRPIGKQEFAQYIFNLELDFQPGTNTKYSNIGYLLLGMVVEKASGISYIDYLNNNLLSSLSISDVFVGRTRRADHRANEVRYEDLLSGPDASIDPFDPRPAAFPYGGSGAMTEVMDSGGGLITTARSLSLVIFNYNNSVQDITDSPMRNNDARRDGNMPGSSAVTKCFLNDAKTRALDMAFIFNQMNKGIKQGIIDTDRRDRFTQKLEDILRSRF